MEPFGESTPGNQPSEPAPRDLEFTFNGGPVGYFTGKAAPAASGRFNYMPYRSPSHFAMQEELTRGQPARCVLVGAQTRVEFSVVKCPTYGVLEIADVVVTHA